MNTSVVDQFGFDPYPFREIVDPDPKIPNFFSDEYEHEHTT